MKILVAKFQLEANEHVAMKCDLPNVAISYDQDALTHMQLGDVFNSPDIELVPAICADAACSGVMKKTCFDYIEQTILNAVPISARWTACSCICTVPVMWKRSALASTIW